MQITDQRDQNNFCAVRSRVLEKQIKEIAPPLKRGAALRSAEGRGDLQSDHQPAGSPAQLLVKQLPIASM